MTQHFEQELETLKKSLLTMASHAENVVSRAVQSVMQRDDDLALQVQLEDDEIDRYELVVDEQAIQLLSKAPLARDLRFITVAMKISHDLERVGDEATTISRRSIHLGREPKLRQQEEIPRMAAIATAMLKDALDSFVARNPAKARAVIPLDKEVDRLHKQLHTELTKAMTQSPETVARSLHLMVISKSLERVADHATNIAEEVVYLCEALDIRHLGIAPVPAAE
jgi:phosphate transport system protein